MRIDPYPASRNLNYQAASVISAYNVEAVMHATNLRKVGGSIMLAVPPPLLDLLNLGVGAQVDIAPGSMPSRSAKSYFSEAGRDMACQP